MKVSVPLKENHKALWNWLAANPDSIKGDWPGWKTLETLQKEITNKEEYKNASDSWCFACGVALGNCFNCPCEWGGIKWRHCLNNKSLFSRWAMAKREKTTSHLAHQIAELWK